MTNMAVSKQTRLFQSPGSQHLRTKALNYQVHFGKLYLLNVNFHKKNFFSGNKDKKFSCQENQELSRSFYMFPENTTMDVSAEEELVITIDNEVGVICQFQLFPYVSF